eukprot:TRINITY_DN8554_c1_g1_i2.p1 TRINITY_DN8554_c1_g1~~TRINITY_DN8554_c1_g1_i2.p1  ORF type:complete len:366 (+),score=129.04 TRINITY_DN8554_c1_g1_i2:267-1364(+)
MSRLLRTAAPACLSPQKAVITASGTASKEEKNNDFLTLRAEDLEILEVLGVGSSGQVRKARHIPTDKVVALKEIKLTNRHLTEIGNEMQTLYRGENSEFSPYVIEFYGAYLEEGSVVIALEYMQGSLLDMINPGAEDEAERGVPEDILAKITRMVLEGLDYLHSKKHLVHRDLKPSNLLYNDEGTIKITDFGVSHTLESSMGDAVSFVGTLTYMSPERLNGESYKIAADIWGLGVTLVEMVSGHHPFHGILPQQDYDQGTEGRFWKLRDHFMSSAPPLNIPEDATHGCRDFLLRCLEKEPGKRCSASDLLQHDWIGKNTSEDVEDDKRAISSWLKMRLKEKKPAKDTAMSENELHNALDDIIFDG